MITRYNWIIDQHIFPYIHACIDIYRYRYIILAIINKWTAKISS